MGYKYTEMLYLPVSKESGNILSLGPANASASLICVQVVRKWVPIPVLITKGVGTSLNLAEIQFLSTVMMYLFKETIKKFLEISWFSVCLR